MTDTKHGDVATGDGWELRCGDWREVLADVEPDAVITDPPYGSRTHDGQRTGRRGVDHPSCFGPVSQHGLGYEALSEEDVGEFVTRWSRAVGWFVCFTSHDLIATFERYLRGVDRYVFAPLAVVTPGMNVRLVGDGPSNWTVHLVVARPRREPFSKWGTLPGAYIAKHHKYDGGTNVAGAKGVSLMRSIVRDYTRPTNEAGARSLIVDPCAGGATTLLAAVVEGRRAIGAEVDPATFDLAVARLRRGYTPAMDFG